MHQHGWTAVILWIEMLVRPHHNLTAAVEYGANLAVGIVYLAWTCVIAYMDHVRQAPRTSFASKRRTMFARSGLIRFSTS